MGDAAWQSIVLAGADVSLRQFCDATNAQGWFARLHAEIAWQQHRVRLFGREIDCPRLSCWIGNADAVYTYSRTRFEPRPWIPALRDLRETVSNLCREDFNSVLCNLYRDGRDSMGWHSDDEPELGPDPIIASLSFGASRRFRLRHRRKRSQGVDLTLDSGSLLRMAGATQRNYRHDLPKTRAAVGPRINLTFRRILVPGR